MLLPPTLKPAGYELAVQDLHAVSDFYQNIIGLRLISTQADRHHLGVGDRILLSLHHQPNSTIAPSDLPGLYHAAFLLPSKTDLAHYLAHALENNFPILGSTDHLVSQGFYLKDPEGNGVEIYIDNPRSQWHNSEGKIHMGSQSINLEDLLGYAPKTDWSTLPDTTRIGHLHLQIDDLSIADRFYGEILHLKPTYQMSGARFFASDTYHHHIAVNNWQTQTITKRSGAFTGLTRYHFSTPDPHNLRDHLHGYALKTVSTDKSFTFQDPWGLTIEIGI